MKRKVRPVFLIFLALMMTMMTACGLSENNPELEEIGADWRSTGMYSNQYLLDEDTVIYFLTMDCGYSIYINSADNDEEPNHFCELEVLEEETGYSWEDMTDEIAVEDIDGDGIAEIGLTANDGNILWYRVDAENYTYTFLKDANVDSSESTQAMPEDFDLAVEDLPEYLPDVLNIRDLEYDEMPFLETQDALSEYALWNLLWGNVEFECRLSWDLSHDLSGVALYRALEAAKAYYLFSSYISWDMYTEDDGDPDSVYAKVKLIFDDPELDLEAQAEALEYVMKNPVPEGGFTSYEQEMEYARGIHDFVACKVTYDPRGFDPQNLNEKTSYENLQEAYNVLGEDQHTVVCAGYARAFALIAQYAGINCAWVRGNETDADSHAWNIIYPCDGSDPVLVDVTWDDGLSNDVEGQTEVSDQYFYIPLSIETEHTADENILDFLQYLNSERL